MILFRLASHSRIFHSQSYSLLLPTHHHQYSTVQSSLHHRYHAHHSYITISNQYFSTQSKSNNKSDADEELELDLTEDEIKEAEAKKARRQAKKFKFNEDFDDFESYQKKKQNPSPDTSNYYHEYFRNKAKGMFIRNFLKFQAYDTYYIDNTEEAETESNTERKRLKKPKGPRKTDKEKAEESETRRLKIEYRLITGVILAFTSLIGYYFYYATSSDIGRADTNYKTAVDYELKIVTESQDEAARAKLIKNAEYYYIKALENTDYNFPKYLHKYSEFLLNHKKDYVASEHYITKALGLHKTNAIYHQFYCKLLKAMIEENGNIERLNDYFLEKQHTVNAHLQEATYFLSEEGNEKAAIMHIDHALNFCDQTVKNSAKSDDLVIKLDENVDEIKNLKASTYIDGAELLAQYGFRDEAKKYWDDGIKEHGKYVHIQYGAYCYQQQDFEEALRIFRFYTSFTNDQNLQQTAFAFLARLLSELGQYGQALQIYTALLPKIGVDPMVLGDMVHILIKLDKVNEAKKLMVQTLNVYRKRLQTDDLIREKDLIYINMINVLLMGKMNDIENGNMQCLEMIAKYPNEYDVNYIAALYYHKYIKNYDKADRYYRTAISIEDQWAKTYYNYSLLFYENNDFAQFVKYIKIAYEKNPKIPMIKELYLQYFDENGNLIKHEL